MVLIARKLSERKPRKTGQEIESDQW